MAITGNTWIDNLTDGLTSAFEKFSNATGGLIKDLDTQATSVVAAMGQSRNYAEGIRQNLADAVPELAQIAKDADGFSESLKMAAEAQLNITKSLQTNILLTSQQMVEIAQVTAAYGIQSNELGEFVERFVTAGESINNFPSALEKSANFARSMGVNVDATMDYISKNLDEINKFGFKDGVEGLGRMSARMAAMRIDMNAVYNFADKVFDPENAISMVAGFQKMGVAAGDLADPFRLMYLASEDVEELQKQIGKAVEQFTIFDEKSKTFKISPQGKRDLRELEQQMGISYDDLVKYSQQAERLRIVGREIKIGGVSEESKQFIANIAQFDEKAGGFVVKFATGDQKLVSQIMPEDIQKLEEANRELSPKEIARAQLNTLDSIRADVKAITASVVGPMAGSRTVSSVYEAARGGAAALRATFQETRPPRQQREEFDKTVGGISMSLGDILSGTGGFSDLIKNFTNITTDIDKTVKSLFKGITEIPERKEFKQEIMSDNQFIKLGNVIGDSFQNSMGGLLNVLGIESTGGLASTTINQNTNVTVQPVKVDVNGDINIKGANGEKFALETNRELAKFVENIVKTELDKYSSQKTTMSAVPAMTRTA